MTTSRVWLGLTVLVTLLVMGGMVAWGLRERAQGDAGDGLPSRKRHRPTRVGPMDPDRELEMPAGCEVDAKQPPKIAFDLPDGGGVPTIDFGPMRQGQTLVREVVIRNVGSGTLCIPNFHTGCGCVRLEMPGDKRIAPTTTATARVTVEPGHRHGLQDKTVILYTNDPSKRTATFRVLADVRLGVVLLDAVANFGQLMRGKSHTATLRLKSPVEDAAWQVTAVEGAKAAYAFETEAVPSPDPAFRLVQLRITHPGTDQMGPQSDTLKVRTSHPDHPEFVVHANLMVVDRYYASPPVASLGYMAREMTGSWLTIHLLPASASGAVPFAKARIEGRGFELGEATPAGSGEWRVQVRPDTHGLTAGRVEAALVATLDDPEMPEVRVPLRVDVLERMAKPPPIPK